ncbi:MAG TPA: TMEM175 family protein [Acidimicrobiales bacterium]
MASRLLALSDGVFAIAMTLLVLNLRVPAAVAEEDVGRALRDTLPALGAYALSFVVIALFWLGHHRLFQFVARVDRALILLNLVQLGLVALIPFPTEVLGGYGDQRPAAAAYAVVLGLAGAVSALAWVHVLRAGLAHERVPRTELVHGVWRATTLAAVFLGSLPLAAVSATLAEWSWATIAVVFLALARHYGPVRQTFLPEG